MSRLSNQYNLEYYEYSLPLFLHSSDWLNGGLDGIQLALAHTKISYSTPF